MPTPFLGHAEIARVLADYGYLVVVLMVGVEGMDIPLPGETTLIVAAIVAGTTQELNIGLGIAAVGAGWLFLRRNEERLEAEAERADFERQSAS